MRTQLVTTKKQSICLLQCVHWCEWPWKHQEAEGEQQDQWRLAKLQGLDEESWYAHSLTCPYDGGSTNIAAAGSSRLNSCRCWEGLVAPFPGYVGGGICGWYLLLVNAYQTTPWFMRCGIPSFTSCHIIPSIIAISLLH